MENPETPLLIFGNSSATMVKKKSNDKAKEVEQALEANTNVNEPELVVESKVPAENKSEAEAATNTKLETAKTAAELPTNVREYLQRHPEVEKVYIDQLGGVFSANTPVVLVKDAVLYQNPYFKH